MGDKTAGKTGGKIGGKIGAVLPLVLVVLLALSLLFSSLLLLPGAVKNVALRNLETLQEFYDGESAIVAKLHGLPGNYFENLPPVEESSDLWLHWTVPLKRGRLQARLGVVPRPYSFREWNVASMKFSDYLENAIRNGPGVKKVSGNRRILRMDAPAWLWIEQGDLSLNFEGGEGGGSRGNFWVDGMVEVRGSCSFDTLRIFAHGDVVIKGDVVANWVEIYSRGSVEVSGRAKVTGIVVSEKDLEVSGRGKVGEGSLLLALGASRPRIVVKDWAEVAGFMAAPLSATLASSLATSSLDSFADQSSILLPVLFEGRLEVGRSYWEDP